MKPYRAYQHLKSTKKYMCKKLYFKKILNETPESLKNTSNYFFYLGFFPTSAACHRYKSFCAMTKKTRSVFRKFKMARIAFRELVSFVTINGVSKASW